MSTDSEIIQRSLGRPSEFGELFFRHAPRLHRYVSRRIGEAVADDILSETFLLAFEKRSRFDHTYSSALPWFFGIATNLIHRQRVAEARTLKLAERTSAAQTVPDSTATSDAAIDAHASARHLAADLRKLSKGDRDVLLLYAWEDLTYEQIGHALGIPTGTVRSRLNRARRILREAPSLKEKENERVRFA
ncbi:RNA polymerase sigma factor [Timonella senegalensis]|uniref:RNA polymerase sigma factor n=1 Tax=Timonella senegalensis TaxID=1465825 RepID=UPI00227F6EC5|nr:RNA polymerase sigma factor [Timonella senegalensis]